MIPGNLIKGGIMKRKENPNHPKKGSTITVDPIRDVRAIEGIKAALQGEPRNLLLFTMGINNGLRTGDLLKLKVKDVRGSKPGRYIFIKESKTGKSNVLMINEPVCNALTNYLEKTYYRDEHYLFRSLKGENNPLTIQAVNNLVKKWTRGLKGNYGAHSLRKTFGYIQRTKFGVSFEVLCKRFNHSSPSVTMRYLGICDSEINGILHNEI